MIYARRILVKFTGCYYHCEYVCITAEK